MTRSPQLGSSFGSRLTVGQVALNHRIQVRILAPDPKKGGIVKPTVGRMVHYVSYGTPGGEFQSECRAAVIAAVDPDDERRVDLVVLNPNGLFFNNRVKVDENKAGGTWHWPEREEG